MSVYNRLYQEYKCLCILSQDDAFDRFMFAELLGKINFAAECKLITFAEWENLRKHIKAFNGG